MNCIALPKRRLLLFALTLFTLALTAQERGDFRYYAQINAIASDGKHAPFWFTANNNGISSVKTSSGYARYGMSYSNTFGKNKDFRYNITADVLAGFNQAAPVWFQQAYGELSWRWLTLAVGSKERGCEGEYFSREKMSNTNLENSIQHYPSLFSNRFSSIGSGGLIFSSNSRPIPEVRIEIPEFLTIPGTKDWLRVRAYISYGIFSDSKFQKNFTGNTPKKKYAENILYHGKAGFISVGNTAKFPVTFEGGLEMLTQFGGTIYNNKYYSTAIKMPHTFMDFVKAFIPMGGSEDTPTDEQTNISGNQLGNWHLAFTIHTKPIEVRLYGEHMFEDYSQLFFFEYQMNNVGKRRTLIYPWRDFLVGINIANKSNILPFISNIRYEYVSARDQSGALYHDPSNYFYDQMDGCDNYYNHGIYPGWHHWGMGIGSPLAISPAYNENKILEFRSNRFIAHNVGINGIIECRLPIAYRFNYTYSEHWGTYNNPFSNKKYTTSLLAEITCMPKNSGWTGTLSVGYDKSNFIGDNFGLMFTVTRVGSFFK